MATTKINTPELFDFSATNTALQLPTGTTAQRPTSPSAGEWRFNTTEKYVEFWDGGAWRQIDTEAPPNPDDFPSQNFNVNTYTGTGATQTIDAKFNEAANFNGSSSQITLPDSIGTAMGNNNFSVSFWVNVNSASQSAIYLSITRPYDFYVATFSGVIYLNLGTLSYSTGISLSTGWHHIAVTKSSSSGSILYLDNNATADASKTGNIGANSIANSIGNYNNGTYIVDGKMDQVRIFNTAITASQVSDLYTNETTTTAATLNFPAGAGCVAAYQLDGDASDVGGTYGGVTTDIGYTGLRFQPDFVWIKARSDSKNHVLVDSVRGNRQILEVDVAGAQVTSNVGSDVTGFNSNGFGLGPDHQVYVNPSGTSMVAWCLKAGGNSNTFNVDDTGYSTASAAGLDSGTINPSGASVNTKSGFSIIQYTTSGVQSIAHGLGKEPQLIIQRNISIASYWPTYVSSAASPSMGNGKLLRLNDTPSVANDSFFMSAVGSDTFTTSWSGASYTYINYCFANIANYQKVGSYTGNSSTSNIISTEITAGDGGFEPAFVIIKAVNSGDNWYMLDNKRLNGGFPYTNVLYPNLPNAEAANVGGNGEYSINFLTNGFELTEITAGYNQSGAEYFYLAIAADKDSSVPTQANSFSPTTYTGTGGTNHNIYTPFAPDFTWIKSRSIASSHGLYDTIRGAEKWITSNGTSSTQSTPSALQQFNPNGFTLGNDSGQWGVNAASATYISWNWKAGGLPTINSDGDNTSIVSANQAAGFSIIRYRGNGNNDSSVGHGLNSSPEMFIYKRTSSTGSWNIVHKDVNNYQAYLEFTTGNANNDSSMQSPTDSVIRFNTNSPSFNGLNQDWLIYAFHSVTGYQKVGSYPANGSTTGPIVYTTDDGTATGTGGFEPRFLLIKSADNASTNWIILDKARTPNNPMENDLKPNSQAVEQTGTGNNYPQATTSATGFQVNTTDGAVNGSGTYIYLAIA